MSMQWPDVYTCSHQLNSREGPSATSSLTRACKCFSNITPTPQVSRFATIKQWHFTAPQMCTDVGTTYESRAAGLAISTSELQQTATSLYVKSHCTEVKALSILLWCHDVLYGIFRPGRMTMQPWQAQADLAAAAWARWHQRSRSRRLNSQGPPAIAKLRCTLALWCRACRNLTILSRQAWGMLGCREPVAQDTIFTYSGTDILLAQIRVAAGPPAP